ncbi:MAG: NAD-glutamate dehydrogenase domain-containing protein, partial [Solirubrobacteraceae bacterium]
MKAGDLETDLLDVLDAPVGAALADEPPAAYREFVRQYYQWVPRQDISDRSERDLAGAVVAHYRLAKLRVSGEAKVRVYNPEPERDGWGSPYTVLELVSDDMPFIVDSVTMELNRQGYGIELIIHPVMRVVRDNDGELLEVVEAGTHSDRESGESVIHVEVGHQSDSDRLAVLQAGIEIVLEEVKAAVEDWEPMRSKSTALAASLAGEVPTEDPDELAEAQAFLAWLADDHFTFLGYREYELHAGEESGELRAVPGTGLGILRGSSQSPAKALEAKAFDIARSSDPLVLTKANSRATVHRPLYMDYVGIKRFADDGTVIGERRFLGLYTHTAYKASAREVPLLRGKIARILERAAFPPDSHDAKGLIDILESLPRDLLIQIDTEDVFAMAIGILGLGERQRVRLFVCRDQRDRFVACSVCLPRDRFNTQNRLRAGRILAEEFGGDQVDWRLHLSESVIVRVDYVVHCPRGVRDDYDVAEVESQIARATRAWTDDLRAALISEHGQREGLELYSHYGAAFPRGYQAYHEAAAAVEDIARIREQRRRRCPIITTARRAGDDRDVIRCKLLSAVQISLSDVVPTFEHMGAEVVDERPYEIDPRDGDPVWLYDFGLRCDPAQMSRAGAHFDEVFLDTWANRLEDDALNGLVMAAGLGGSEITVLRVVLRYLRQVRVAFSEAYMTRTLLDNPAIATALVRLFAARFDPDRSDQELSSQLAQEIGEAIDRVQSLDEDRILRGFLAVMTAMLRTNHFRRDSKGRRPSYLSFKLDPGQLEIMPQPRPRFEIFVYSPRVEGVHLRGGKVARGGVRWSDRREDFRTEILGLMKAQTVKNALIVPVGSKGGFIVKRSAAGGSSDQDEAIACYRTFLRGLLDLTDNYVGDEIVAPERVIRYDDDDPYLVVAADKGTAAFSDVANEVAAEYGFWLGDAFAS